MAETTSSILGPDGRPYRKKALTEEQAGPSLAGVRQYWSDHPSAGLTPQKLAALLRAAEDGDMLDYLSLAEDMEEKDLHYQAVLGTRKRAICQLDITVEPASDAAADVENARLVEDFLNRDELEDELFDILDALGKGFSQVEILWETSERQWMPARLEYRDPRWFEFDRLDGRTIRLRGENGLEELWPWRWISHRPKVKSGLPVRAGLARMAAWCYLFKNYTVKDWVAFAEIYGQPLRVGKYGPSATPEEKRILLRAVANLGTDAAAIIPDSMIVEYVKGETSSGTGPGLYERLARFMDEQVSKGVLGQTTTVDAISGGHAVSKEHNEVREDIERADARQLAAVLNRDLVRPLVAFNRGPQKAYPKVKIGRPDETDMGLVADAVAKLVPLGFRVSQQELRTKFGFSEPDKKEEILAGSAPGTAPPASDGDTPKATARGCPIHGKTAARSPDPGSGAGTGDDDAIDDLVEGMLSEWEEVLDPALEPIRQLLDETGDLEAFRDRLPEILPDMDVTALAELIARGAFAARLAAETDTPLHDDEV